MHWGSLRGRRGRGSAGPSRCGWAARANRAAAGSNRLGMRSILSAIGTAAQMRFHSPPINRGLTGNAIRLLYGRERSFGFREVSEIPRRGGDSQSLSIRLHRPADRQQHAGVRAWLVRLAGVGPVAAGFWRLALALPFLFVIARAAGQPVHWPGRALAIAGRVRRLLLRRRPRRLARRHPHDQARQRDAVRQRLELRLRRLGPVAGARMAVAGCRRAR